MFARIRSVANHGLTTIPITVEVDVASRGLPNFTIVGLASKAVEEAKERVKTALVNSGCTFPSSRITVNLAPADVPKEGTCYDLPIAVGILIASGEIVTTGTEKHTIFYGELSLDGSLRHTRGVLLVGLGAKRLHIHQIIVPSASAPEASCVEGVDVLAAMTIADVISHLIGTKRLEPLHLSPQSQESPTTAEFDLCDVRGQAAAKRALMIAAAGGHNLLMSGPPGSGKTMLARSLPGILPPLSLEEAIEVSQVYSVMGLMEPGTILMRTRPFRCPHHSISAVGMIGGGSKPAPGEVSLAHLGVLFLDEMAEFPRQVLEGLRQPLEDGKVVISRSAGRLEFVANFMLVAAVNPCPCGYLGHPRRACQCTVRQIAHYKQRLSGPILDRIDMHITVPAVEAIKITDGMPTEMTSIEIQKLVTVAREIQRERFAGTGIHANAQMKNKQVKQVCMLNAESTQLLKVAIEKYDLSARSYYRILKVARTIADLAKSMNIETNHLAEAIQYRVGIS